MGFLQVKSTNKNLSYVISKNPMTGMIMKSLRRGVLYGYYSENDDMTYNVYFRDSDSEVSYKRHQDEDFEYINTSRYNSWLFVLNASTEMFRDVISTKELEHDIECDNEVLINMGYTRYKKLISHFNSHYKDLTIEETEVSPNSSKLLFKTKGKTLKYTLSLVNLFALSSLVYHDEEYIFIEEEIIKKYIRLLNLSDAPYFIRYMVKTKLVRSPKTFKTMKSELEGADNINMKFGDNGKARFDLITNLMKFENHIIDIGCGELKYAKPYSKEINKKNKHYLAIDIDEKVLAKATNRIKRDGLENVVLESNEDNIGMFYPGEPKDIIMTEVVEHMPIEDAKKLVLKILNNVEDINSFIITTPNVEFNKHYSLVEGDIRHDDHDWEPTKTEFLMFIEEILSETKYGYR